MKMKRILSAALVLAMLVGFVPGAGVTAEATGDQPATKTITQDTANHQETMTISVTVPEKSAVPYLDWDDTEKKLVEKTGNDACKTYNYVLSADTAWGENGQTTWYVASGDVPVANRVAVTGDVRLILCDGATLTASKGITVTGSNSLTIYGQTNGTGALTADATTVEDSAGIGGGPGGVVGIINVYGGTVNATGGNYGAGIGGGQAGSGGTVTITGGTVNATGGVQAAGIGGGNSADGGTVIINGGTVTATGYPKDEYYNGGAGIGGGASGSGGTVTINGGTVTAVGSDDGDTVIPGIGAGESGSGGSLTANGMTIYAGSSAADAATNVKEITDADNHVSDVSGKMWVYIEKNEPLTSVTYLDEKGESQTLEAAQTTYTRVKPYTVNWTDGWYVVDKDVTITGEVTVSGNAKLILTDGATLTVEKKLQCIGSGPSLAIYGQTNGTGTLRVKGDNVGILYGQGNNVIYGGTLDVSGVSQAISVTSMGKFTIAGGTVNAAASRDTGTGIDVSSSATLTIRGGAVTASGQGKAINVFNYPGIGYGTMNIAPNMVAQAGADEASAEESDDPANEAYKWVRIEEGEPLKSVSYLDEKGEAQTLDPAQTPYKRILHDSKTLTGWYVVDKDVEIASRITVNGGVHLILMDGAELKANKGITTTGATLNIYAQSTGDNMGKLTTTGDPHTAGIGSAGTGNGGAGTAGSVTINGGKVTATGGAWSAGIGGGNGGNGGPVMINGGTVIANGGSGAAGIGGGTSGNSGDVTINGGTVTATAGASSTAGYGGAGIGGGRTGSGTEGKGGTVAINGGTVTAIGSGGAPGIGAGCGSANHGAVTIGDGLQVKAGASETDTFVTDFATNFGNYKWACIGIFHTHNFTSYILNDAKDTITAVCDNADQKCPLDNHTATLTIAPKDDGTATLTGGADFGVSDTNIVYYSQGEGDSWAQITENNGKPSGDGFYTAKITVGGQTAQVEYGVNQITLDKTYTNADDHGTIPNDNVPSVATIGAIVSIPTIPADGYQLKKITATGASNVSKDGNTGTFTMPNSAVTVSAEFEKRNVGVKLVVDESRVAEPAKESCKAALLTYDAESQTYATVPENFTSQVGDKFILRVDSDEAYDFTITGTTGFNFTALSSSAKKAYVSAHADANANTQLFEVTMPGVPEGNLIVTVTFLEIKNYTVLYQPDHASGDTVWCKIGSGEKSFQLKMNPDAQMGNVRTFALNVSMTSVPQKIAFGVSELADNVKMTSISVKESAADAETWQTVTGSSSDKFLVISGSARTLIAAFTPNNTPYAVDAADVKSLPDGTQYQIAVCESDAAGTVTAPAALTDSSKNFVGWGYKSAPDEEDTYDAGASISITDDAIFGAVWTPKTSTVTVDLKGGDIDGVTDPVAIENVVYDTSILTQLQALLPTKDGFALDGWTVNANVTEGGKFFSRGSAFDPNTNITSDLGLNAKWKHVHSYTCVPLSYFGDALKAYSNYAPYIHVRFCGCADVKLEAHTFRNGVCTGCGADKPGTDTAALNVFYWIDGATNAWMQEDVREYKKNEEVTVSAFYQIGDYKFSKWQYRFSNEDSWKDLAAGTMVGFLIPRSMQVRALYTEVAVKPQVSLSARSYVTQAQGYEWDTVLFQMEYKLPKDCTYVDAGIRMGDNQGISFYSLRKRKVSAFETAFNFITSDPISFAVDSLTSDPDYIIEKREDNVLGTMSAATLAKYMMENKPINIPEYKPIYWQANPATKGRSGSVNTLTPLRFIQKNNGNHYIYGVAYLTFKDSKGVVRTIYTNALAVTRNDRDKDTVTATYPSEG